MLGYRTVAHCLLQSRNKISIILNISILGFYENIGGYFDKNIGGYFDKNIGGYFDKNIGNAKINQNTLKFMEILC